MFTGLFEVHKPKPMEPCASAKWNFRSSDSELQSLKFDAANQSSQIGFYLLRNKRTIRQRKCREIWMCEVRTKRNYEHSSLLFGDVDYCHLLIRLCWQSKPAGFYDYRIWWTNSQALPNRQTAHPNVSPNGSTWTVEQFERDWVWL